MKRETILGFALIALFLFSVFPMSVRGSGGAGGSWSSPQTVVSEPMGFPAAPPSGSAIIGPLSTTVTPDGVWHMAYTKVTINYGTANSYVMYLDSSNTNPTIIAQDSVAASTSGVVGGEVGGWWWPLPGGLWGGGVSLSSCPNGTLQLAYSTWSGDTGQGTIEKRSFTNGSWSSPQTVFSEPTEYAGAGTIIGPFSTTVTPDGVWHMAYTNLIKSYIGTDTSTTSTYNSYVMYLDSSNTNPTIIAQDSLTKTVISGVTGSIVGGEVGGYWSIDYALDGGGVSLSSCPNGTLQLAYSTYSYDALETIEKTSFTNDSWSSPQTVFSEPSVPSEEEAGAIIGPFSTTVTPDGVWHMAYTNGAITYGTTSTVNSWVMYLNSSNTNPTTIAQDSLAVAASTSGMAGGTVGVCWFGTTFTGGGGASLSSGPDGTLQLAYPTYAWDALQQTIQKTSNVANWPKTVNTHWDWSTDFYSFPNYGLFKDGGDCWGFSSTAILYFTNCILGDQSYPFLPVQSAKSVADLLGQTNVYYLSQSTFPIYIHQTYDPIHSNLALAAPPVFILSQEQVQAQNLMQSIKDGKPVLVRLGPSNRHAIVAWGYTQYENGNLTIRVSDPNYGNTGLNNPRYAYYNDSGFSYTGVANNAAFTWTTFSVVSPGMVQWSWLSLQDISAALKSNVTLHNDYYNYVFSNVPITIISKTSYANFTMPGNSLTFTYTINGAVGFEEGNIQVYGIPKSIPYSIKDPGENSSQIMVIIPLNETSIIGYRLTTTSQEPLNMTIVPTNETLNMTTSGDIESSMTFFSIGQENYSVLNATSIPVNSSQTAVFTVPDWDNLNSTQSAVNLQIYEPGNSNPVVNINLTNPVIPEYPSTTMLFLFTITTLLMAITYRRKRPVDAFSAR